MTAVTDIPQDSPDDAVVHPPPELLAPRVSAAEWIWLAMCVAIGTFFRAWHLSARPLWADELTTLITARRSLGDSLKTAQDPQPPLHQMLVRLLMGGNDSPGESVLRAPACAFGIATIAAVWWCARHFVGRLGAGLAAILIACNPWLVHHARDARPYALFVFFAALSITFFYRMVKARGLLNAAGYAISTAGMFFSHYYAMFFVAGQVGYALLDLLFAGPMRRNWKTVILGGALGALGAAPILYMFARLLTGGMKGSWWIAEPSGVIEGVDTLGDLLGLRSLGVLCLIPLIGAFWLPGVPPIVKKLFGGRSLRPPLPSGGRAGVRGESHDVNAVSDPARAHEPEPQENSSAPTLTPALSLRGRGGRNALSPSHPLTHSPTHPLTHSPTHLAFWRHWWLTREPVIYLALLVLCGLFLPLIGSILVKPGWIMRYSLPAVVPMLILALAYLRSTGPVVAVMVLGLLLPYSAYKSFNKAKGDAGLREAVQVVQKYREPGDVVMLPDWPFAEDYINPDAVGVKYYGFIDAQMNELKFVLVDELDAVIYRKSRKLTQAQVDAILFRADDLLPRPRTWAICFHSTSKVVREFLTKRGRTFEAFEFGLYDDGRTPMYTLIRIDPRR